MYWIPAPIYKSLPYVYILIGIVCFYLSFSSHAMILYIVSGTFFSTAGLLVMRWRYANRKLLVTRLESENSRGRSDVRRL